MIGQQGGTRYPTFLCFLNRWIVELSPVNQEKVALFLMTAGE